MSACLDRLLGHLLFNGLDQLIASMGSGVDGDWHNHSVVGELDVFVLVHVIVVGTLRHLCVAALCDRAKMECVHLLSNTKNLLWILDATVTREKLSVKQTNQTHNS